MMERTPNDACPGEHTVNKDDDGYFWITCGADTVASATFASTALSTDIQTWMRQVMDQHLIVWLRAEIERLRTLLAKVRDGGSWGWDEINDALTESEG